MLKTIFRMIFNAKSHPVADGSQHLLLLGAPEDALPSSGPGQATV